MTSATAVPNSDPLAQRRRWPVTLWLGILLVAVCEIFLFIDVHLANRGPVRTAAERLAISPPGRPIAHAARWVAVNMTALVWIAYLILLEGLLTLKNGASPVRRRPNHFLLLCLASAAMWVRAQFAFDVVGNCAV